MGFTTPVSISLDNNVLEALDRYRAMLRHHTSRSRVISDFLRNALIPKTTEGKKDEENTIPVQA